MRAGRRYFLVAFLLDQRKRWVIWYSGERDGFVLSEPGKIATFETSVMAMTFAADNQIHIELAKAPSTYDFDRLLRWTRRRLPRRIKCEEFLDAWNFITDVVATIGASARFNALNSQVDPIYRKLFWGSNIPSVTPNGKSFIPNWSNTEMTSLANLLRLGAGELRRATSA